jgi:hypothetical protein
MDGLQLAVLPLAAFWVIFKTLVDAADFVNKMRDKVVSGMDGGNRLDLRHRKAMRTDWIFSVSFTVLSTFLFSGLIFWIAAYIHNDPKTAPATFVICLVACFPLLAGVLFIVVGVSDMRLMNTALAEAEKAQPTPAQTNNSSVTATDPDAVANRPNV